MTMRAHQNKDGDWKYYVGDKEVSGEIWLNRMREMYQQLGTTFRRSSQNQTASSGVEGAHEGTTADKKVGKHQHVCEFYAAHYGDHQCACGLRTTMHMSADDKCAREPEKLNNAQKLVAKVCHEFYMTAPNASEQQTDKLQEILEVALAESSLSQNADSSTPTSPEATGLSIEPAEGRAAKETR